MRYFIFLCLLLLSSQFIAAQLPGAGSDKERMLEALRQSGMVRQEGNHIIFKVKKASDTPQIRLMYGNLFASDKYTIGFDVFPVLFLCVEEAV